MAEQNKIEKSIEGIQNEMSELTLLSFRKIEDVRRLANHFRFIIDHPATQEKRVVHKYLKNLDDTHKRIFTQKREGVEVEYIFTTEKKSNLQRQRFNSLPISEVPELLKAELLTAENAKQVHICTDCDVEIELNDEEPLMESLQKHFNLEVHMPKPKRESVDVSEPIVLPNMSRRLSAMESGETPIQTIDQLQARASEKLERIFSSRLEASLIKFLPDTSEASIDTAMKFYQEIYDSLCHEATFMDFSVLTSSVAPIIMSIKDNVNQNFATDANKNFDNEENETPEKPTKNQNKKYRYYGPIEKDILNLLSNHKLLTLVDDRTGKLAFFCIACEYYTLRFRYDSVLSHVFSNTHVHNLACIIKADQHIPFPTRNVSSDNIVEMNQKFLLIHNITEDSNGMTCGLCKTSIESMEASVLHILDEGHLGKVSDKWYRKVKASNLEETVDFGPKSLDWAKFLASVGKPLNNHDHVVVENFIKPSGKITNYCSCCEMTLKGPRQVLFNHIRQKKHLRNAAPHKLAFLYKNHCRPSEYFASFGNYFVCAVCPEYIALPSFAAIVEHTESQIHIEVITKIIRMALYGSDHQNIDEEILANNKINVKDSVKCELCDDNFENLTEAMSHVLSNIQHQNSVVETKARSNKGDIISVYMQGNYILHSEGSTFNCTTCKGVFNSIRSLLAHLIFAEHFKVKPTSENIFRFYLELKHNINMLGRNKYVYYEFGKLKCGVCDADVEDGENAKRHVVSASHRENMGASYVNLDTSAAE